MDIEQTKQMVDLFLSKGFTYFDTAYGYLNGKSEKAIKAALVDRYPRESYQLATKLPAWTGAKTAEEARAMLATSLERTGAGYFDFYLLHNLGDNRTEAFDRFGIWDFLAEQKAKGVIKHLGFSFHNKADVLDDLLNKHPNMEFVQLQINYADWESASIQSRACYEVARKHGKPVVIMEPVKGGSLANLPEKIAAPMKEFAPNASLPSWAIRYAASLDGLVTVLSGMSSLEQYRSWRTSNPCLLRNTRLWTRLWPRSTPCRRFPAPLASTAPRDVRSRSKSPASSRPSTMSWSMATASARWRTMPLRPVRAARRTTASPAVSVKLPARSTSISSRNCKKQFR